MKKLIVVLVIMIISIGSFIFYNGKQNTNPNIDKDFEAELRTLAKDTYQFLEDYTDPNTGLTMDRVDFDNSEVRYEQTSPTNIGMYLASTISAAELGIITKKEGLTGVVAL